MDQSSATRPRRWGESPMFKAETKRETLGGVSYFEMRLRKHKSQRQGETTSGGSNIQSSIQKDGTLWEGIWYTSR